MLEAETYMSAQTCIDEGFADGMMWEAQVAPSDPAERQTAAMMQSRSQGRQAVLARLREHGAPVPGDDAREQARRAEIAKRAGIIAGLYKTV